VENVGAWIDQEVLLVKNRPEAYVAIHTRLNHQNLVALPSPFFTQSLCVQGVHLGLTAHHLKFFVVVVQNTAEVLLHLVCEHIFLLREQFKNFFNLEFITTLNIFKSFFDMLQIFLLSSVLCSFLSANDHFL